MSKNRRVRIPVEDSAVITSAQSYTPESTADNKSERAQSTYPLKIYEGKNYLPSAYGYKSFWGTQKDIGADLPAGVVAHDIFVFQTQDFKNVPVALTDDGIYVLKPEVINLESYTITEQTEGFTAFLYHEELIGGQWVIDDPIPITEWPFFLPPSDYDLDDYYWINLDPNYSIAQEGLVTTWNVKAMMDVPGNSGIYGITFQLLASGQPSNNVWLPSAMTSGVEEVTGNRTVGSFELSATNMSMYADDYSNDGGQGYTIHSLEIEFPEIQIEGASAPAEWVKLLDLPVPPVGTSFRWTMAQLSSILFLYREDQDEVFFIEEIIDAQGINIDQFNGAKVAPVQLAADPDSPLEIWGYQPTLLNMEGQIGIYRAGASLGFWDSDNAFAFSAINDYTDFAPSLTNLANITKINRLIGRVTHVIGMGRDFVIYGTRSIIRMIESTQGTTRFIAQPIITNVGVAYPREVVVAAPDTTHYCWTSAGLMQISQSEIQPIIPDIGDYLKQAKGPQYLSLLNSRYLCLEVLDPDFINGNIEFSAQTVDPDDYVFDEVVSPGYEGEDYQVDGGDVCYISGDQFDDSAVNAVKPHIIIPLYAAWIYSGATVGIVEQLKVGESRLFDFNITKGDIFDHLRKYYPFDITQADLPTFDQAQVDAWEEDQKQHLINHYLTNEDYNAIAQETYIAVQELAAGSAEAVGIADPLADYIIQETAYISKPPDAVFAYSSDGVANSNAAIDLLPVTLELAEWAGNATVELFNGDKVDFDMGLGSTFPRIVYGWLTNATTAEANEVITPIQYMQTLDLSVDTIVKDKYDKAFFLDNPNNILYDAELKSSVPILYRNTPSAVKLDVTMTSGFNTLIGMLITFNEGGFDGDSQIGPISMDPVLPYSFSGDIFNSAPSVNSDLVANEARIYGRVLGNDSVTPLFASRGDMPYDETMGIWKTCVLPFMEAWIADREVDQGKTVATVTWKILVGDGSNLIAEVSDSYPGLSFDPALELTLAEKAEFHAQIHNYWDLELLGGAIQTVAKTAKWPFVDLQAYYMTEESTAQTNINDLICGQAFDASFYPPAVPATNITTFLDEEDYIGLMATVVWWYNQNNDNLELDGSFIIGASGQVDVPLGWTLEEADAAGWPTNVTAQALAANQVITLTTALSQGSAALGAGAEGFAKALVCGTADAETVSIPEVPAITYEKWEIETPPLTFVLSNGLLAPYDPTFYGAYVFDLHLKKWGQLNTEYKNLINYQPISNYTPGVVDHDGFNIEAGALLPQGVVTVFDFDPAESYIRYGKFQQLARMNTQISEVGVTFRHASTGLIAVQWSVDGRVLEYGWSEAIAFENALNKTLQCSKIGQWATVTVAGKYDITGMTIKYKRAGDR